MQLNYRGVSYSSNNTLPEIGTSEMSGQYRGATVKLGSQSTQASHPTATLRYRGAAYNNH